MEVVLSSAQTILLLFLFSTSSHSSWASSSSCFAISKAALALFRVTRSENAAIRPQSSLLVFHCLSCSSITTPMHVAMFRSSSSTPSSVKELRPRYVMFRLGRLPASIRNRTFKRRSSFFCFYQPPLAPNPKEADLPDSYYYYCYFHSPPAALDKKSRARTSGFIQKDCSLRFAVFGWVSAMSYSTHPHDLEFPIRALSIGILETCVETTKTLGRACASYSAT